MLSSRLPELLHDRETSRRSYILLGLFLVTTLLRRCLLNQLTETWIVSFNHSLHRFGQVLQ